MQKINFDNYKFRCSSLGKLMTNPRNKSETLSETTKSYLQELWICEVYGREKVIKTKEMQKGVAVEEKSITMAMEYFKKLTGNSLFLKNTAELENKWIKGTPDIRKPILLDIKSSWDITTFPMFETEVPNKDYYWQVGVGYAWLCGLDDGDVAKLVYTLTNLPDWQLQRELKYAGLYDMNPESEEYVELEERIEHFYNYDDMSLEEKIKVFDMVVDTSDRELLKERITESRKYLNSLTSMVGHSNV